MYFPADFKKYPVYEDIAQLSSLSWGCSWYIMATCLGYSSGITGSIYGFWYLTFSLYILWFWIFMWPIEKKLWFCSWHILTALSKYCSIFLEFCLVGMLPASLNSFAAVWRSFHAENHLGTETRCWGCLKTWKSCRRAQHSKQSCTFCS